MSGFQSVSGYVHRPDLSPHSVLCRGGKFKMLPPADNCVLTCMKNAGIMARAASGLYKKLTVVSLIRVRLASPLICYLPLTVRHSRILDTSRDN